MTELDTYLLLRVLIPKVWEKARVLLKKYNTEYEDYGLELNKKNIDQKISRGITDEICKVTGELMSERTISDYFLPISKEEKPDKKASLGTLEIWCAFYYGNKPDKKYANIDIFREYHDEEIKGMRRNSSASLGEKELQAPSKIKHLPQEDSLEAKSGLEGIDKNSLSLWSLLNISSTTKRVLFVCLFLLLLFILLPFLLEIINDVSEASKGDGTGEQIPSSSNAVLANLGLIALLLFIWYSPFGGRKILLDEQNGRIWIANSQFAFGWSALWITWLILYVWLSLGNNILGTSEAVQKVRLVITDFLNLSNGAIFAYLFLILDKETYGKDGKAFNKALIFLILTGIIVMFVSIYDWYFLVGKYDKEASAIVPVFVAISMMFLFGRLDSKFFNIDRFWLVPLYFYASIQVLWSPGLETEVQMMPALLWIALMLKGILFFMVSYWIKEGKLRIYFQEVLAQRD